MSAAPSTPGSRAVSAALAGALQRFADDARFLVALSGGVDSIVLLHAAVACVGAHRCIAAHINHGLSADAEAWQLACAAYADRLGVSFVSRRVQIASAPDDGIEAEARVARYDALASFYRQYDAAALLLAQHADDQAETVLLQLLRGSGLPGLAAMGAQAEDGYGMLRMRPLLACTRAEIEAYARGHGLRWVEDGSNSDTRFARNALRHDVMPALARHFPGYREALARTARHAAQAQSLLDQLARADLRAACIDPNHAATCGAGVDIAGDADAHAHASPSADTQAAPRMPMPGMTDAAACCQAISRAALKSLDAARAANLLRYWMRTLALPAASEARLDAALRQLRSGRTQTALRIDHAGHVLRAYRDRVSWQREPDAQVERVPESPPPQSLTWRGQSVWRLAGWRGTLVFRQAPAGAEQAMPAAVLQGRALCARARSGGERMRTGPGSRSRTLKNLFQERGIPAWRRHLPLLFVDEILLWVPGLGLNHDALAVMPRTPVLSPVESGDDAWLTLEWVDDMQVA